MGAHHVRQPARRVRTRLYGRLHRRRVATEADRNETAANALHAQQVDASRFGGGVGSFEDADQALGLDETDGCVVFDQRVSLIV